MTLHSFTYSDGSNPQAALIQASDGSFYGTTVSGGVFGNGTVFKIDAVGTLTTLHSFTGSDGSQPYAGLIEATDGHFYGTTSGGGAGFGTVFKLDGVGPLTTVHSFTRSDGDHPLAGLIQASDGSLYGTTSGGGTAPGMGSYGYGTVFKIESVGSLTTLHSFTTREGDSPY